MCVGALVMFASPFLAFRVATGQLVEGLVSTISGWFSGLASVAIGYVTSQLGTAYAQQAEVVQAEGALKSALTQATFGRQAAYASAEGQKLASNLTAQAGLESSYIAAGANLQAAQINADASRSAAYLGAGGQLESSLYGIGANQLGTVGGAAISAYKDLSNLSLAERQEVMRQGIEYWAAQGDANAKFWQEAIRLQPEILDSGAQNFGQGVRSIPFLGSLFGIVASPEDVHRSLNSMAGFAADPNKSMILPGDGGNLFPRADGRLIELPKEVLDTPFGKTLQESLGKGFGLPPLPPNFVQPKLDALPLPGSVAGQLPPSDLGNIGGLTREQQRAFGNMSQLFRREPNFLPSLTKMAQSRGINPDHLLNLMALETAGTFNRAIHNGKGYVGLIQFGEAARQDVGLPRDYQSAQGLLSRISATQQLPYVFSYLDQKAKTFGTPLDTQAKLYAAVGAGGIAKSDQTVMFRDGGFRAGDFNGTRKISNAGFNSNPAWNVNKDGVIQQWEFGASAYKALGAGQKFSVLSGVGRTTQDYGASVKSTGKNLNNSGAVKNNSSGITTYQPPVIPDGQNYLNQLNKMNYIGAKTAAPQMANEIALRSNLAIAKGKLDRSSQTTHEFYTGSRNTVEQSFQAQTNLAGDVANLSKQGAYAAYVGQTKSADAAYVGQNQAAQLGYYGQTQSAQRSFAGQNQAAGATYAAQTKSADLQFAGQREAALIQQQTALHAARLRAMSALVQSVGNTAGHQFAEAFEKFNRF